MKSEVKPKWIRGPYSRPVRCDTDCSGPSLAQQEFKDECDINKIMKKYREQGVLTHRNNYEGRYDSYIDAPDFHTAMNAIADATSMFMDLPAEIRSKYGNDPAAFLEAAQDPDRQDELRELGLIKPDVAEPPPADPATNPPAEQTPKAKEGANAPAAEPKGEAPSGSQ